MEKVCIMGAGSWGTAQALVLNKNGFAITLWGRPGEIEAIAAAGENRHYLPGLPVPKEISLTSDLHEAVQDAGMIVVAVPSQAVREVLQQLKAVYRPGTVLVNTAKGIEINSGMRMSQVARM